MIVEVPFKLFSVGGLVTLGCSVDASVLVVASVVSSDGKVVAPKCSSVCGLFSFVKSSIVRVLGGFKSDLNSLRILTDSTMKVIFKRSVCQAHIIKKNDYVRKNSIFHDYLREKAVFSIL